VAFPSSSGSADLDTAWSILRSQATRIKNEAANLRNLAAAGPLAAVLVVDLCQLLSSARTSILTASQTSGLEAYARTQINNPSLDLVAAYNAMSAQVTATIDWIRANFPKDDDDYLLVLSIDVDGVKVWRTFTPEETAGLRTVLDSLVATID
jgi:hypothetical protein